jgi:hypothetical protein
MITVKAKKQTELEMKRRHRSGTGGTSAPGVNGHAKKPSQKSLGPLVESMSVDSQSRSPDESTPLSPNTSPIPAYSVSYHPSDHILPKPFQHGRDIAMSSQPAIPNTSDISEIFLAHIRRIVSAPRN